MDIGHYKSLAKEPKSFIYITEVKVRVRVWLRCSVNKLHSLVC